jgi:beta-lactamase class A
MRTVLLVLFLTTTCLAQTALTAKIEAIATDAHGRVGVACSLPGTALDCDVNPDAKLPMQSVFKFPLGMAVLNEIEHGGKLTLETKVRFMPSDLMPSYSPLRDKYPQANVDVELKELLRLAVSESDNVAADILARVIGGPETTDKYLRSLGIEGIRVLDTERGLARDRQAQYRNYAEPQAMVKLLRRLADNSPLSAEHTALLIKWMTDSPTGPHRLKAMLPAGTQLAHKTGTSGVHNGVAAATNDVGLITLPDGKRMAVAVFVSDSRASEDVRDAVIARIGHAIYDAASQKQ